MNWSTEVEPTAPGEIHDAIAAHVPEGLTEAATAQLEIAKAGAKAAIRETVIAEGWMVGVELAGETGPTPTPVVTMRVRLVEAPPEPQPEAEPAEEDAPVEEKAAAPA